MNYLNSEIYNSDERIEKFEASISNYLLSLLQNSESIDIDPEALALLLGSVEKVGVEPHPKRVGPAS